MSTGQAAGEAARKRAVLEYTRLMSAGDVDAALALFAEDVVFEDPVGSGARRGRDRLREHLATAVGNRVHETPGTPVAAQDGAHAACPVTVRMSYLPSGALLAGHGVVRPPRDPGTSLLRLDAVLVVRVGADGLIEDLRAHWGLSDVGVEAHRAAEEASP